MVEITSLETAAQDKAPASMPKEGKRVEFTGTGREFFGIWIVNILLSVVTLGIYSAWATVRTRKYMAGHTIIDGQAMQYHARGIQLLIGRLLALGVVLVLTLMGQFFIYAEWLSVVYFLLVFGIFFAVPWILNRAFRFHNRMTTWRGVRFNWTGTYGQAFMVMYIWPLLYFIPFMNPFVWRAQQEFLGNNSGFGTKKFALNTEVGPYYMILLWLILMGIGAIILLFVPLLGMVGIGDIEDPVFIAGIVAIFVPLYIGTLVLYGAMGAFFFNRVRNLSINNLQLVGIATFASDAKARHLLWIIISSGFLALITLGLYIPWAIIRIERHLRSTVTVFVEGDIDGIVDHEAEAGGAFGAEYVGIEGIDVGI